MRAEAAHRVPAGERGRTRGLWFGLLGPLEVRRAGGPVDPGPPQRRVLLLRLLLEEGRFVGVDRLCEDLWAGRPPAKAQAALHAHLSRLRSALEPDRAAREREPLLVRGPGGYALRADVSARDSAGFERSLELARALLADGRPAAARTEVDRALGLWRGPALAEAGDHPFAAEEVRRLEEARIAGRELHVEVLLAQGCQGQAVAAARALTDREPLRESCWDLLLRSLRQAGRPAEAVREYERCRRLLRAELGVEPGPALRRLNEAIRQHRPVLPLAG
ncbi:BTAD domain-containing putative transcriptional regulator [Streptomyces sp. TRM 70361]|uniref:AfsR/SARP family transcriptional regulator n=1 Tax=Streptomyces sp. TRM 70361 TaxID=3116553 RepID=UPI002E7BE4C4|nr:BTAD domain-containing putative transcriptional regulator [Streptomyces sp. TRM 70361]MEE1940125.1 BTAD domain-containing putative transcriptional regulator [Streptomyces sp. TRM 70361]